MRRSGKTGRRKLSRGQESIRRLIDLKGLTGYGIQTYGHGEIVLFSVRPSNLSVLSPEGLTARINSLMNVLKGVTDVAMLCLSSREDYQENKEYLRRRMRDERSEEVRRQLALDIQQLDSEQTNMATAREFFLVLNLRLRNPMEIPPYLSHMEQIICEQGFSVRRAEVQDLMRVLSMYLEQNVTSDRLELFDGERFVVV